MSEIGAINGDLRSQKNIQALDISIREQQSGQTNTAKEVQQIIPVLRGGTTVTNTTGTNNMVGTQRQVTGVEEIDQPDSDAARLINLEKLIAYLTMENDEQQAKTAQERIKSLLSKVKSERDSAVLKINQAIEKTQEMLKQQKMMKIFGWIMTAVAALAAIAATVATFGAAAGPSALAIVGLVATWLGVAMSVTTQAMQASGAMDELIEKDAKSRYEKAQKEGKPISMEQARADASAYASNWMTAITAILGVASLGAGVAQFFTKGAEKIVEETIKQTVKQTVDATAKTLKETIKQLLESLLQALKDGGSKVSDFLQGSGVQKVAKLVMTGSSAIGVGGGVFSGVEGINSARQQRELAKMQARILEGQKIIDSLQALLEEENEDLQLILEYLMNDYEAIADVLTKGANNVKDLYNQMAMTQV